MIEPQDCCRPVGIAEMTLRDHFAAEALNGLLYPESLKAADEMAEESGTCPSAVVADLAYIYADAMMKRRDA